MLFKWNLWKIKYFFSSAMPACSWKERVSILKKREPLVCACLIERVDFLWIIESTSGGRRALTWKKKSLESSHPGLSREKLKLKTLPSWVINPNQKSTCSLNCKWPSACLIMCCFFPLGWWLFSGLAPFTN